PDITPEKRTGAPPPLPVGVCSNHDTTTGARSHGNATARPVGAALRDRAVAARRRAGRQGAQASLAPEMRRGMRRLRTHQAWQRQVEDWLDQRREPAGTA